MEALRYSVHAYVPPGQEPPGETSSMAAGGQALLGIAGAGLRCSWRGGTRTLVLAGKVFEDILGSGNKDPSSLPATIDHLLGGVPPRSILCTGACVGGLLATLAAAWAALRWPDSDVRCIVFGTPRLANAAFNHAFGWLVGLSYRCVYRFDPMPEAPMGAAEGSRLLGLLGRLRLEFTPTQPGKRRGFAMQGRGVLYVFLDGRGRARLEDRPIQVHYRWSDHDLRAYLATLLELAEEHHWSVSPPVNQMAASPLPKAPAAAASRVAAASARSTQLLSSVSLPNTEPAAAQRGVNSAAGSPPRGSFGSRLRGLFTCQPAPQPVGDEMDGGSKATAWQDIKEALGQIDQVHSAMFPGPGRYVGEAAADAIAQRFAAGQEAAEAGSAGPRQPGALQRLVARRLRLPLRLSRAAYESEEGFRRLTGIACSALVHVAWLPAGAAGTAVFAFRGTSNRADMLADIKVLRRQVEFLPTQLPGAKCHLGFLQQALALTSATSPAYNIGCVLADLSDGTAPSRIICCGHSLGGAVASIASVWAALQWPHADVRCFSFGAPKCGNRKFVRALQTLVGMRARVVNNMDPIPSLPPAWVARYCHASPTCHLRGSELVLSPVPPTLFPRLSLRDHQLLQYAKALAAAGRGGLDQGQRVSHDPNAARQDTQSTDQETKWDC
ncbi:hypothetical protein ABPG77_010847 [Micractinium sp. CCAP 211/92]